MPPAVVTFTFTAPAGPPARWPVSVVALVTVTELAAVGPKKAVDVGGEAGPGDGDQVAAGQRPVARSDGGDDGEPA